MEMKFYVTISFIAIFISGCVNDAPHDNPLDPHSLGYSNLGDLTGQVIIASRSTGISGALVTENTLKLSVGTDSLGFFSFTGLLAGGHTFICSKENFTADTFHVTIQAGEKSQIVRGLNGAPNVASQKISTRKIDYVSFSPQYFVDVEADVSDPNTINDLDSVWFNVDSLLFPMTFSPTAKKFVATVYKSQFPTNTIQILTGKPLHIISRDQHFATNISEPFYISRVIENTSTPISPAGANTVRMDSLFFKWIPPDVTFNYTTTITVYRTGTENVVWSHAGVISFFEELQYPTDGSAPLLSGNYFWTATVADDFGNYARSKESYFVVK